MGHLKKYHLGNIKLKFYYFFTNLADVVVLLDSCHQRLVFKEKLLTWIISKSQAVAVH